jgi:hypothetical protein
MTADHGDNAVPGRLDTDGESSAGPRFDVVVRGYDRRQVDEHIADLERTMSRQRAELEQARESGRAGQANGTANPLFTGGKAGGDSGGLSPDMITAFTGRLQAILQAAEEEAEDVRTKARNYARKEEEAGRARLAELERRRESMLADLNRVRTQLDGVLSAANKEAPIGANLPPGTPPPGPHEGLPPRGDKPHGVPGRPEPGKRVEQAGSRPMAPIPERPWPGAGPRPEHQGGPEGPPRPLPGRPIPGPVKLPAPLQGHPPPQGNPVEQSRPLPQASPVQQSRQVQQASPAQQSGAIQQGGSGPHPKPRPTPSPRSRPGAPGAGPASARDAGVARVPAEQPARDGVLNRENDAPPARGEEPETGRSAFDTGGG